jgi:hypothetical protein
MRAEERTDASHQFPGREMRDVLIVFSEISKIHRESTGEAGG